MSQVTAEEKKKTNGSLVGRTLYIPRMSIEGASAMAAVYRSIGVNGQMSLESDSHTLEIARKYTIGEECYPEMVTRNYPMLYGGREEFSRMVRAILDHRSILVRARMELKYIVPNMQ